MRYAPRLRHDDETNPVQTSNRREQPATVGVVCYQAPATAAAISNRVVLQVSRCLSLPMRWVLFSLPRQRCVLSRRMGKWLL